jgi:hypothetical protein
MARVNGIPDYPFLIIGHPIADNDDAALLAKAEAAVPRIVALLTERK